MESVVCTSRYAIGVACKIKLGGGTKRVKLNWGRRAKDERKLYSSRILSININES